MKRALILFICSISLLSCGFDAPSTSLNQENPKMKALKTKAPVAKQIEFSAQHHGYTLSDPWHWLRDPDYPKTDDKEILSYLEQENTYYQTFLAPNQPLVDTLFEEFKGRVDETETSVPWSRNGYEYRWFFEEGQEYRTWVRKPTGTNQESVFLDEPELAKNHDYFVLGDFAVSPDNRYLAYTVDTSGEERFLLKVIDLTSNRHLDDEISNTSGSVHFSADSQYLLYGALEKEKWRVESINSHRLGQPTTQDAVLHEERDDSYFLDLYTTSDDKFFIFQSSKGETTEAWALATDKLDCEPQLLATRDKSFEYQVDHAHGHFYIRANDIHVNYRIAKVADDNPEHDKWTTLIEGSDEIYIRDLIMFDKFMALKQNVQGLEQLYIRDYEGNRTPIDFPEALYTASFRGNAEFNQSHVRLSYESMISPDTVFDYVVATKELKIRKVKKIPSGYDKSQYETKRIMATARDGAKIPISLLYKKGTELNSNNNLHLYAYGAYGSGMSPSFSTIRFSLVDRDVVYAIAHVRGGNEMGYQWYLDGKLEKRTNTFNDFVDVAKHLIHKQYTRAGNISISGRSAGGELMGAAVIQAPELWSAALLGVPFVDVLNTMLDASLPLTPPEWDEWGNPIEDKKAFELLRSYSPYDNITARSYPPMMVTGGLNDPRVTYWEPAKWTAKMRHLKTDDNLLVMRINMGAGHFANSGRYGRLKDYAEEYAFVLLSHGIEL